MPLIQAVGFNIGLEITAADPDLQVLAKTVSHTGSFLLLLTDGAGASPQSAFYKREQCVSVIFQGRTAEPRKHCALPERKTFK